MIFSLENTTYFDTQEGSLTAISTHKLNWTVFLYFSLACIGRSYAAGVVCSTYLQRSELFEKENKSKSCGGGRGLQFAWEHRTTEKNHYSSTLSEIQRYLLHHRWGRGALSPWAVSVSSLLLFWLLFRSAFRRRCCNKYVPSSATCVGILLPMRLCSLLRFDMQT